MEHNPLTKVVNEALVAAFPDCLLNWRETLYGCKFQMIDPKSKLKYYRTFREIELSASPEHYDRIAQLQVEEIQRKMTFHQSS